MAGLCRTVVPAKFQSNFCTQLHLLLSQRFLCHMETTHNSVIYNEWQIWLSRGFVLCFWEKAYLNDSNETQRLTLSNELKTYFCHGLHIGKRFCRSIRVPEMFILSITLKPNDFSITGGINFTGKVIYLGCNNINLFFGHILVDSIGCNGSCSGKTLSIKVFSKVSPLCFLLSVA